MTDNHQELTEMTSRNHQEPPTMTDNQQEPPAVTAGNPQVPPAMEDNQEPVFGYPVIWSMTNHNPHHRTNTAPPTTTTATTTTTTTIIMNGITKFFKKVGECIENLDPIYKVLFFTSLTMMLFYATIFIPYKLISPRPEIPFIFYVNSLDLKTTTNSTNHLDNLNLTLSVKSKQQPTIFKTILVFLALEDYKHESILSSIELEPFFLQRKHQLKIMHLNMVHNVTDNAVDLLLSKALLSNNSNSNLSLALTTVHVWGSYWVIEDNYRKMEISCKGVRVGVFKQDDNNVTIGTMIGASVACK